VDAAALEAGGTSRPSDLDPIVVSIEAKLRRAGKGKRLVIENGAGAEVNAGLAAMIAEAFAVRNQLLSGSDASIEAMTERLGIAKGRLTSLVRESDGGTGLVGHVILLRLKSNVFQDKFLARALTSEIATVEAPLKAFGAPCRAASRISVFGRRRFRYDFRNIP
jgi:hypothetical protein